MGQSNSRRSRRRGNLVLLLWVLSVGAAIGAMAMMPRLTQQYFWGWLGSQEHVIEVLREEGQWEEAVARADRLIENMAWDPRPLLWRAQVIRDRSEASGLDPVSDPAVQAAYEQTARAYFRTSAYPFALSPTWKTAMAETFQNWASTSLRQRNWQRAGLCLEYAADLDQRTAQRIAATLERQTRNPAQVDPAILVSAVRIFYRHRSWEEARDLLSRFEETLDPLTHAQLDLECAIAMGHEEPVTERLHHQIPPRQDLPLQILKLEWATLRQQRWHQRMHSGVEVDPRENWMRANRTWDSYLEAVYGGFGQGGRLHLTASDLAIGPEDIPRDRYRGWPMWNGGELNFIWNEPMKVEGDCWLMMSGDPTLGIWPVAEVIINEGPPQLVYIRSEYFRAYPVDPPEEGFTSLTIRYLNDGGFPKLALDEAGETQVLYQIEDRNLHFNGLWWVPWAEHNQT